MAQPIKLEHLVYSAESGIHGTGLFARKSIQKGEFIGTYHGEEVTTNSTYVLWVYEDDDNPIGRKGNTVLRYLNHSVPGNAEFDGFDLYAIDDIKPHDEITFDYKEFD